MKRIASVHCQAAAFFLTSAFFLLAAMAQGLGGG